MSYLFKNNIRTVVLEEIITSHINTDFNQIKYLSIFNFIE